MHDCRLSKYQVKAMPIEKISNRSGIYPKIRANRTNKDRKTAKPKGAQAHALKWLLKFNIHFP